MTVLRQYNSGTGTWDAVISGVQGSQGSPMSTNASFTAPFETFLVVSSAYSGSSAATVALATSSIYVNTAGSTANYALNITGAPTTVGQSVTAVVAVNEGASAFLPNTITINTYATAASGLPANASTYTPSGGPTFKNFWQGAAAPSSAYVSTLATYSITIMCVATNSYYVLYSLVGF